MTKKTTIFTDAKDTTTVGELKQMIEGILKVHPDDQLLYKNNEIMKDDKPLHEYGISVGTARAQSPAQLGLASRVDGGDFEELEIAAYSSPQDLPDVMKNQDPANGQEATHITS